MYRNSLEIAIRSIVKEVLFETFSSGIRPARPETVGVKVQVAPTKRRRRRGIKGRVTDPTKDRRLKANKLAVKA